MPFTARNEDNQVIYPYPGKSGFCRVCGSVMISKCGEENAWHFAHKVNNECYYGSETAAHLAWKKAFHAIGAEIEFQLEKGRADVFCPKTNTVVEIVVTNPSNKQGLFEKQMQYIPQYNMVFIFTNKSKVLGGSGVSTWEDELGWQFKFSGRSALAKSRKYLRAKCYYEGKDGRLFRFNLDEAEFHSEYLTKPDGSEKVYLRDGEWVQCKNTWITGDAYPISKEEVLELVNGPKKQNVQLSMFGS